MGSDGLVPLAGGFSGETFVADAAGERTVVRVYAGRGARRGSEAAAIDAAVLQLVRGLLPVPQVLELRRPDPVAGTPGVLVTSFLPGERLDACLPGLSAPARGRAGRGLGRVLGRLAQMPMPRAGQFTDARLRIEPWQVGGGLEAWIGHLRAESALAAWPEADYRGLLAVAATAQDLLDEVPRHCLVHSDFNAKNLLIDLESGALTGLLDWEFAHAGAPGPDLGNLLRFDREPVFADAVLDGYLEVAGHLDGLAALDPAAARDLLLRRARAADLLALADLAGRRGENPVTGRADAQLRAIAVSGDLSATA
ncbi:MAG TPA: phosphotransferase [Streptosporangiaceae bacterium]|nr:phosphotransferase [Streptosporangiaceae bacterium]